MDIQIYIINIFIYFAYIHIYIIEILLVNKLICVFQLIKILFNLHRLINIHNIYKNIINLFICADIYAFSLIFIVLDFFFILIYF
jgi:hypothetical protein